VIINIINGNFFLRTNFDYQLLKFLEQLLLEVAIKQIPKNNGKKLVRKDLVIWLELCYSSISYIY